MATVNVKVNGVQCRVMLQEHLLDATNELRLIVRSRMLVEPQLQWNGLDHPSQSPDLS